MTRSASFDRSYNLEHNNMAIDVASNHEGEEIPLRQMAGLNVQDNYEFAPLPSYNDPASEPLQSTNMSDDGSMSSSTTLCGEVDGDLEAGTVDANAIQDAYQSPALPTYANPASVAPQNVYANHGVATDFYQPRELSCQDSCCNACCENSCCRSLDNDPCCFAIFIMVLLLFIAGFFLYMESSAAKARSDRAATAIETFKNNCVGHGDIVQAHMDNTGVESFSCVHGGNVTVKVEGQFD